MTTAAEFVLLEGYPFVKLSCEENNVATEAYITPWAGANLCRFTHDGHSFIDFDPELLQQGSFTGAFLLYPTCNRMRDQKFTYKGRTYTHPSADPGAYMHGLARREIFKIQRMEAEAERAVLTCVLDFSAGESTRYQAYPFAHRFTVSYIVTPGRIRTQFEIFNLSGETMPFGLGIHPYFPRLAGEAGTTLEVPAKSHMAATPDLLPTGGTYAVEGGFDLRTPQAVGTLDLDTVYCDRIPERKAILRYAEIPYQFTLDASECFTHFVVFTPKGKPYFCVENQTCSTDAINMHEKGFEKAAHLLELENGKHFDAWLDFCAEACII